jgi:hypothetical protein
MSNLIHFPNGNPVRMKNWELFDAVARHLLTQNAQSCSIGPNGGCAYRGDQGRKCAVGFMIPDELMTPDIEGASIEGPRDTSVGRQGHHRAQRYRIRIRR